MDETLIIRANYIVNLPVEIFFDSLLGEIFWQVSDPEMPGFPDHGGDWSLAGSLNTMPRH